MAFFPQRHRRRSGRGAGARGRIPRVGALRRGPRAGVPAGVACARGPSRGARGPCAAPRRRRPRHGAGEAEALRRRPAHRPERLPRRVGGRRARPPGLASAARSNRDGLGRWRLPASRSGRPSHISRSGPSLWRFDTFWATPSPPTSPPMPSPRCLAFPPRSRWPSTPPRAPPEAPDCRRRSRRASGWRRRGRRERHRARE